MKILQMTSDLDGGGVDSILYNYCSRMSPEIKCDFIVSSDREGILEEPLRAMGSKVFHVARIRDAFHLRQRQLKDIFAFSKYDAVHDHSGYKGFFFLDLARRMGINCRIAHSHIASIPETVTGSVERALITPLTKSVATHLFACGTDAARWMWGERAVVEKRVTIMPNGIDTSQFKFSESERQRVRSQMGLEGKFVIGNVARLSEQKNHEFLLRVFSRVLSINPDSILMIVGRGDLEKKLKEQAAAMHLDESVLFLGIRDDVYSLLNAMDVFVLPSKYEGLPVTLVEVQTNGLPVVVSDMVTDEVRIALNYKKLSLHSGIDDWARCIISLNGSRSQDVENIVKKYDINVLAQRQLEWYLAHEK